MWTQNRKREFFFFVFLISREREKWLRGSVWLEFPTHKSVRLTEYK